MDVAAVHRNIVKRPDMIVNSEGDSAHDEGGRKEPYRRQEKPIPARFGQAALVNPMEESARENG
jgi:hypothetical protein